MTENRKPRRRRRWIIPLVAVGAGAWYVRSRRAAPDPWHPALPAEPVRVESPGPATPAVADPATPRHAAATPGAATLDVPESDHPRHSAATAAVVAVAEPAAVLPATTPLAGPPPVEPVAASPAPPPVAPAPEKAARPTPRPSGKASAAATSAPAVAAPAPTPPAGVSTSGALTSGTPNALFTPTAPTAGQGVQPMPDGSAPGPEYTIKGNADSMLFHTPSSPYYKRTKAEVWFRTAEDATAAGFKEWTPKKRTTS